MQPNIKQGLLLASNSEISDQQLNSIIKNDHLIQDHYHLDKDYFARGKFAHVRRIRCKQTGQQFAAKTIKKRRPRAGDVTEEIRHEIRVLMIANNNNNNSINNNHNHNVPEPECSGRIVRLYEVYETSHDFTLVLELAEGGELQKVLDEDDSIEEHHCRRIIRQIVEGVKFLHSKHIAHLDIKPQNILLTDSLPDGQVKLCDFGISRLIQDKCDVREIMGTTDYMPPEILQYEPISLAADMWSIGIVSYVLLSGHTPFGGDDKVQTYSNITSGDLEFPDKLFANITTMAKDFIQKLLVRDPRDRMNCDECLKHQWLEMDNVQTVKPLMDLKSSVELKINDDDDDEINETNDHIVTSDLDKDVDSDLDSTEQGLKSFNHNNNNQNPSANNNNNDDDNVNAIDASNASTSSSTSTFSSISSSLDEAVVDDDDDGDEEVEDDHTKILTDHHGTTTTNNTNEYDDDGVDVDDIVVVVVDDVDGGGDGSKCLMIEENRDSGLGGNICDMNNYKNVDNDHHTTDAPAIQATMVDDTTNSSGQTSMETATIVVDDDGGLSLNESVLMATNEIINNDHQHQQNQEQIASSDNDNHQTNERGNFAENAATAADNDNNNNNEGNKENIVNQSQPKQTSSSSSSSLLSSSSSSSTSTSFGTTTIKQSHNQHKRLSSDIFSDRRLIAVVSSPANPSHLYHHHSQLLLSTKKFTSESSMFNIDDDDGTTVGLKINGTTITGDEKLSLKNATNNHNNNGKMSNNNGLQSSSGSGGGDQSPPTTPSKKFYLSVDDYDYPIYTKTNNLLNAGTAQSLSDCQNTPQRRIRSVSMERLNSPTHSSSPCSSSSSSMVLLDQTNRTVSHCQSSWSTSTSTMMMASTFPLATLETHTITTTTTTPPTKKDGEEESKFAKRIENLLATTSTTSIIKATTTSSTSSKLTMDEDGGGGGFRIQVTKPLF